MPSLKIPHTSRFGWDPSFIMCVATVNDSAVKSSANGQTETSPRTPVPSTGIHIKRILDDDVEFVSEKPVKKRRVSGPQQDSKAKPAASPIQPEVTSWSRRHLVGAKSRETTAKDPSCVARRRSTGTVELPSEPHSTESGAEPRGVSLPTMKSFTFPQIFNTPSPRVARKSEELSPKQLPQPVSPRFLTRQPAQQVFAPLAYQNMFGQPYYSGMQGTVGFMNSLPQHIPMTPEAALNQRMLDVPLQTPIATQGPESSLASPTANLMTLAHIAGCTPPAETSKQTLPTTHAPREEAAKRHESSKSPGVPEDQPAMPYHPRSHDAPTNSHPDPQPGQVSMPQAPHPRLAIPARHPCHICARMRQQACLNNPHGISPPGILPLLPPRQPVGHGQILPCQPLSMSPVPPVLPQSQSLRHLNSALDINAVLGPTMSTSSKNTPQVATPQSGQHPPTQTLAQAASQIPTTASNPESKSGSATGLDQSTTPTPPSKKATVVTAAASRLGTSAEAKRKHAANLYVDIAETCLEIFPYAEVARRHAVSRQRVHDVFAAIIQLPLLRCPTDKRRVGKLGITRMKEYNKAKKDLQAEKAATAAAAAQTPAQFSSAGKGKEAQPSNIFEVAQFMGPLDVPELFKNGFTGPW